MVFPKKLLLTEKISRAYNALLESYKREDKKVNGAVGNERKVRAGRTHFSTRFLQDDNPSWRFLGRVLVDVGCANRTQAIPTCSMKRLTTVRPCSFGNNRVFGTLVRLLVMFLSSIETVEGSLKC